ncbi:hypothetical protein Tco_0405391 [Tanacetum coccineum]
MLKRPRVNKSVDISGTYGTVIAGANLLVMKDVLDNLVGLPWHHGLLEVYKKLGGRGEAAFSYRNRTYRIIATELAVLESAQEGIDGGVSPNSESKPLERKDASGLLRERVRGVESDLVDSYEEGEIRMIRLV